MVLYKKMEGLMKRKPGDKPVVAICYDFDKTLTPDDMQAQGFIQSVGYDVKAFWDEVNLMASFHGMDTNLAYMYKMVVEANHHLPLTRQSLRDYGSQIELYKGVESWFDRITKYGAYLGVEVEHYIISSGLKEMIEGTVLGKNGVFKRIYASSFLFDNDGKAIWPAQAINYTNKTQFLYRIEKGVLDLDDLGVNDHYEPGQERVPFSNMIYIGDSDTDIPCMRLVHKNGGHSIGVYDPNTKDKAKVYKMLKEQRVAHFAPADYSKDSELDVLVMTVLDKVHSDLILHKKHLDNLKEISHES